MPNLLLFYSPTLYFHWLSIYFMKLVFRLFGSLRFFIKFHTHRAGLLKNLNSLLPPLRSKLPFIPMQSKGLSSKFSNIFVDESKI